jgi:putative glutamine amidotransferase
MESIIIAVSKLSSNYEKWLKKLDANIKIIDLYPLPVVEAVDAVLSASAVLLTGGSDIHPSLYEGETDLSYCKNIDEKRDIMELAVIDLSFRHKIPLLGICRGQQILNVARKGSLYADIQAFSNSQVIHSDKEDVYHRVNIKENSILYQITGVTTGIVNSAHHQAVNKLGEDFFTSAHDADFLIEAIESNPLIHPFCLAVQWHPERMEFENALSGKLGRGFLENAI